MKLQGVFSWWISFNVVALGVLLLLFSAEPSPTFVGVGEVGAIDGKCCKPGRRWGCEDGYGNGAFGCMVCPDCPPGPRDARCETAVCNDAPPSEFCTYSPYTVGVNTCNIVGHTMTGCGTMDVPDPFYCNGSYYPGGHYQMVTCTSTSQTDWDQPGHNTVDVDVCEVGSGVCSYSYSVCEG